MTIPVAKNRNNYLSVPPPSCWTGQSGSARAAWTGLLALGHKNPWTGWNVSRIVQFQSLNQNYNPIKNGMENTCSQFRKV